MGIGNRVLFQNIEKRLVLCGNQTVKNWKNLPAVLVLGTGLTVVDFVPSLLSDGHLGPIIAMSPKRHH
jgi:uncharacterized NAD(P)/FAD-binding protein YdhS